MSRVWIVLCLLSLFPLAVSAGERTHVRPSPGPHGGHLEGGSVGPVYFDVEACGEDPLGVVYMNRDRCSPYLYQDERPFAGKYMYLHFDEDGKEHYFVLSFFDTGEWGLVEVTWEEGTGWKVSVLQIGRYT